MGCLSPDWVGSISLVDFFCRHASLFPGLSALLREKAGGKNHRNVMEGEVVRLGNTPEFFNKGRGISCIGPQSFFYLKERI